jgi:hypothetical protein
MARAAAIGQGCSAVGHSGTRQSESEKLDAVPQIRGRGDRCFRAGQPDTPRGVFEVIEQLPGNGGSEYRLKSANEPHQRVAREGELRKA